MSITLEEVQSATGIEDLIVDDNGRVRLDPLLSLSDKKRAIKIAHSVYRRKDLAYRFLLGNMVNDLRLPAGQKRKYCMRAFGDQGGLTVYVYAWVAGYWQDNTQEYDWPWSFYKEAASLPIEEQNKLIERHRARHLSFESCQSYCREWKAKNLQSYSTGITSDLKTDENQNNSTLVILSTNNVELLDAGLEYDPVGQQILVFGEDEDKPIRRIGKQDGPSLVAFGFSVATPQELRGYAASACALIGKGEEDS